MRLDPHSYADGSQPAIAEVDWRARVDFASRTLDAEAVLVLASASEGPLDLDTRDLAIRDAIDERGKPIEWMLDPPEPILGARLRLTLPANTRRIAIRYSTSPRASALQWLTPAQTAGGREPFLFSQAQAIHARSFLPIADTPARRVRLRAALDVPAALRALVAAGFVGREVRGERAIERYEMPQPIPPYLIAFAVGALESRELGPRSRAWAEREVVEAAAREFDGVERMIATAESLFGPYPWERFDILTMPRSFPYGGMENPRLTFLTPTLLAGDRSLVNVVAHELAHSWTGNLVTNATAEHFWLNEGFTVYAERRILEELDGREAAELHAALGRRGLERAMADFAQHPELTKLHTRLAGIDPDEAFSSVPYEKGYLLLRALEEQVGRARWDGFLRVWIGQGFRSATTDDFRALVERELPGALAAVDAEAYLERPGIPERAPLARSAKLDLVESLVRTVRAPADEEAGALGPTEWQLYFERLPRPAPHPLLDGIERRFGPTASGNYEILIAWLGLAAESEYAPTLPRTEAVLGEVGRMKFLKPLYAALARSPRTRAIAERAFARHRDGYHPIAAQVVERILAGGTVAE